MLNEFVWRSGLSEYWIQWVYGFEAFLKVFRMPPRAAPGRPGPPRAAKLNPNMIKAEQAE